jgi:hypothetical protein
MQKYLGFTHRFLLPTTSLLVSSILLTSPSQAATFAASQGDLSFKHFSQSPSSTFSNTNTNTNATSIFNGSDVATKAEAIAFLGATPPAGYSITSNQVFGENGIYLGLGESEAVSKGIFDVAKNTNFSFNFLAELDLQISIDEPRSEKANASGNLGFALVDIANNNVLDYFQLYGNLTTKGSDILSYQNSQNVDFRKFTIPDVIGQQELTTASASFNGYVKRYFTDETRIALVAVNSTESTVSVPAPSMSLGLIFSWGIISIGLKRKFPKSGETCLSTKK